MVVKVVIDGCPFFPGSGGADRGLMGNTQAGKFGIFPGEGSAH